MYCPSPTFPNFTNEIRWQTDFAGQSIKEPASGTGEIMSGQICQNFISTVYMYFRGKAVKVRSQYRVIEG